MDRDWEHLGTALQAARKAENAKLGQDELAAELGVSRSTIQSIERGDRRKRPSPTIRAYARRVGWTDDSVERVLAGGEPKLASGGAGRPAVDTTAGVAAAAAGLPLRIADELSEGSLLDTAVIPLGGDARMVVVVKGKPSASPEEIRRGLEAWRRAQPQLRELDESGGDSASPDVAEM